jgi:hypothetical protein
MTTSVYRTGAFTALDREWIQLCRRNRRSASLAIWANAEPDLRHISRLDDVIPAAGVDRAPVCAAVARLHVAGDDLARRTLLQLLVPGMGRLARRWQTAFDDDREEAAWEVVTLAYRYIDRLRDHPVQCGTATYVLRSVERDISVQARKDASRRAELEGLRPPARPFDVALSAEDAYFASAQVQSMLATAVKRRKALPQAARAEWLLLSGLTAREVADRTNRTPTTVYRQHAAVMKHLRKQLLPAS